MQPHVVETTLADAEPLGELRHIGKIDASQPRCVLWSQDGESEGHLACSLKCRSIALAVLARSKMFTMASCNLFMDEKEGSKMTCIGFWLSAEAVISTPGAVKVCIQVKT